MLLEDKIEIEASRDRVWKVTVEVGAWPNWAPAMEKIQREDAGDFKPGSTALIKQKGMPETRWTVTDMDPGNHFSWKAKVWGMEMIATHIIDSGEQAVTNLLRIEMDGWVVRLFGLLFKPLVLKSLKEENRGLKHYCETGL